MQSKRGGRSAQAESYLYGISLVFCFLTTAFALAQTPPPANPLPAATPELLIGVRDLFTNKCSACHGAANFGGINYILDAKQLVALGKVIPFKPLESRVYIRTAGGTMPPAPN